MQTTFHPWRPVAFVVGLCLTGLGAYGVFEYAVQLEGGRITYIVLAATVIAVMAGFLPPMAENLWRQGAIAKSLMLWAVFVPVLLCVFYANAERMHQGKAGQSAEIAAKAASVQRAESELNEARQAVTRALPAEARANATPQAQCGTNCRAALETAKAARERVTQAEQALVAAQSRAITESPLRAPVWLLPVTLDVLAFLGIWIGLAGPWWTQVAQAERAPARTRKAPAKKQPKAKRVRLVPANANNVVPMSPAG